MEVPPTKLGRVFFLTMLMGILLTSIGIAANVGRMEFNSVPVDLWELFFRDRMYGRWWYWCARIGAIMGIIGYVLAYHYDSTLGRILQWVREGR